VFFRSFNYACAAFVVYTVYTSGAGLGCTREKAATAPPPLRAATVSQSTARTTQARVAAERVRIPAGSFLRGRNEGAPGFRSDEAPPHVVVLSGFALDATLVTVAQYTEFAARSGYVTTAESNGFGIGASEGMDDWAWERIPGSSFRKPYWERTADHAAFERPDAPAVMMSYLDAVAYCNESQGRLPTEAEWEYAMRAGSSDTRYPWGDSHEREPGVWGLNYWQGESHHKNERLDGFVYVSPVRAFKPNAWGVYDAVGNVWQWTADYYAKDAYTEAAALARKAGATTNPRGPQTGTTHVLRGGSWWCGACTCEGNGLNYRGKALPDAAFNNNGFRCAYDL
jgi:formylglycine-generating enzyme